MISSLMLIYRYVNIMLIFWILQSIILLKVLMEHIESSYVRSVLA